MRPCLLHDEGENTHCAHRLYSLLQSSDDGRKHLTVMANDSVQFTVRRYDLRVCDNLAHVHFPANGALAFYPPKDKDTGKRFTRSVPNVSSAE